MKLQLDSLQVENFMSIVQAEARLSNLGLVLITGDNQDDDTFESNGAGKSSFFSESVVWGLYGQTIRSLKADGVINRSIKKNTRVAQTLVNPLTGDTYEIIRHRKHAQHGNHVLLFHNGNNITGKSDTDTNAAIEEIVGMDFLTFTNSIMFGQGVVKLFASATDAEQKKILEQMMQIEVYRVAQDKAKEKVSESIQKINDLENRLDRARDRIDTNEAKIKDLQTKEAELGEKVDTRIKELRAEIQKHKEDISALEPVVDMEYNISDLERLITKASNKLQSFKAHEESYNEIISLLSGNKRDMDKIEKSIRQKKKDLQDLRDGKNIPKNCEACGQVLPLDDTSHLEKHLQDAIEDLENQRQEVAEDSGNLNKLLDKVNKLLAGKDEVEAAVLELKDELYASREALKFRKQAEVNKNESIERASKLIKEQEELRDTTFSDLIEDAINQSKESKATMKELMGLVDAEKKERDLYQFWVDAFGNQGIKSKLLDGATPFLNTRVNYYLSKLTGDSIEVTFQTQQKISSGANKGQMKDKFSVDVNNKNGHENYEGNSGGEKRRVDISINMSLQDLVMSRTSKRLDLIVYDECFDGLDAVGCEKVIQLLEEKAEQFGTVLVITHNDHLKQLFSKSLKMCKLNGETTIREDVV